MNAIISEDIQNISSESLPWNLLSGKTVLVAGATGMIPGYIVRTLMNIRREGCEVNIIALSRSEERLRKKFAAFIGMPGFEYLAQSISDPIESALISKQKVAIDIIFQGAGSTDAPGQMDMINTINANVIGTKYCLELLTRQGHGVFCPFSSASIFGLVPNRKVTENEYGLTDLQSPDAPYIQSKRLVEVCSYAYHRQYGVDVVVPRIPWTLGPEITRGNGIRSDFLYDLFDGKDLLIKSDGRKIFPFCYISDVVSAIFYILFFGRRGEPYNIVADDGNLSVKDFATLHTKISDRNRLCPPNMIVSTKDAGKNPGILIDNEKICSLGWRSKVGIKDALQRVYACGMLGKDI